MTGLSQSQREAAQFLSQRFRAGRVLRSAQLQQKIAGHVGLKRAHLECRDRRGPVAAPRCDDDVASAGLREVRADVGFLDDIVEDQ